MYLCLIPFLVVVATAAICPYGGAEKRSPCPYMNANSNSNSNSNPESLTRSLPVPGKKGVFLMTRNGPVTSELYVANADGSNARSLLGNNTVFEFDAQWAPNGEWIILTSERNGDGNPDVWRVRPDGSGLEAVAATPAVETAGSISPDGTLVAYQGTLNNLKSNIWIQELSTGNKWNITNSTAVAGNSSLPDGHFRPAWSPNGEWLVFSSDKDTLWRGHNGTKGWENTQENSIYTIRLDGTGYRRIANKTGYSLNSPKFSPDGTRIVYYEIETEDTFYARLTPHVDKITSQIVSVDFATGDNRIEHTSSSGVKIFPQYVTADTIGYLHKGSGDAGTIQGLNYTSSTLGGNTSYSPVLGAMRSPSWSPNGTLVLYQLMSSVPNRVQDKLLYSWQEDWEYRYTDILPRLNSENILAITTQKTGNASVVTMEPNATDQHVAFNDITNSTIVPEVAAVDSLFGAYQPSWSPDNQFIATGWGNWFQGRDVGGGVIVRTDANGSSYEVLTNNSVLNSGFPSYSPDGKSLVYRQWDWDGPLGLRILNLTDMSLRVLTTSWDNLPSWSADGETILFTRRVSPVIEGPYDDNYAVCTIKPDGSDFKQLTASLATDAHAVWSYDGTILYNTGEFGFQDEASIYDFNFQPYAQIMSMNADGTNQTPLTNGMWEDGMPIYIPNSAYY